MRLPTHTFFLVVSLLLAAQTRAALFEWTWVHGPNTINDAGSYGTQGVAIESNVPPARRGGASWTGNDGRFWLFGGATPNSNTYLSDLRVYDPGTNLWTWKKGPTATNQSGSYGVQGQAAPTNNPGARHRGVT